METQLQAYMKSLVGRLVIMFWECWLVCATSSTAHSSLGLQALDLPELAASASISDLKEDESFFFKQSHSRSLSDRAAKCMTFVETLCWRAAANAFHQLGCLWTLSPRMLYCCWDAFWLFVLGKKTKLFLAGCRLLAVMLLLSYCVESLLVKLA